MYDAANDTALQINKPTARMILKREMQSQLFSIMSDIEMNGFGLLARVSISHEADDRRYDDIGDDESGLQQSRLKVG